MWMQCCRLQAAGCKHVITFTIKGSENFVMDAQIIFFINDPEHILAAYSFQLPLLFLAGADTERRIQRAETNEAGQYEYTTKDHEYQAQCAGHHATEIQISEYSCDQDPDDTIGSAHVLFHVVDFWFVIKIV
jgi:hypothetical protein